MMIQHLERRIAVRRLARIAAAVAVVALAACHSGSMAEGSATPDADSVRAAQNRRTRTSATDIVQITDEDRARFSRVELMIQAKFAGVQVYALNGDYAVRIRGRTSLAGTPQSIGVGTASTGTSSGGTSGTGSSSSGRTRGSGSGGTGRSTGTAGSTPSGVGTASSAGSGALSADAASLEPLVVVDGIVQPPGELAHINPSDVDRIEIIKDGAAAFYGSRGANGVIVITLLRGKP